jgi:hypothetical protein
MLIEELRSRIHIRTGILVLRDLACLPPLDLQNSIILRTAIVINNEGGLGGD